jgi:glutathione S-transferase
MPTFPAFARCCFARVTAGAEPLTFYDISSPLQPRSYAPNPSKSRYALSFKRVSFNTKWVDILDIPDTRTGLNCPACRKLDDGSDYYTLPMLQDPASGRLVGDSFDIACYLEDTFPESGGCLFPNDSTHTGLDYESPFKDSSFIAPLSPSQTGSMHEAYARFNWHVDTTFTANVVLVGQYMPFNPETAEAVRAMFVKRAHLNSWEDLCIQAEMRQQLMAGFQQGLTSLAELYRVNEGGPYLEGDRATYADMIVGGWLNMLSATMPTGEWKEFSTWHGGVFAGLHDALQQHYYVCR